MVGLLFAKGLGSGVEMYRNKQDVIISRYHATVLQSQTMLSNMWQRNILSPEIKFVLVYAGGLTSKTTFKVLLTWF